MPSIGGGATRGCCNPQSFAPQPLTRRQPNRARGFQGGDFQGCQGLLQRPNSAIQRGTSGGDDSWTGAGKESRLQQELTQLMHIPTATVFSLPLYNMLVGGQTALVCSMTGSGKS